MIAQTAGAALALLTSTQRQKLAGMAALAYEKAESQVPFTEWRHSEVQRAVGKAGLRECRNEDYLPLQAHFNELLGNSDAAFRAHFRHANEPRSWAMFSLRKAAKEAEDVLPHAMAYAGGFLKKKRGVSLEDADDQAIWHAIFTVRRKAQSLRKKRSGGESAADVLAGLLGGRR